jgi:hypothetical protein
VGPRFRSRSVTSRCGPAPKGPGWRSLGPRQWPGGWLGRAAWEAYLLYAQQWVRAGHLVEHFHLSLTTNRRDRAA